MGSAKLNLKNNLKFSNGTRIIPKDVMSSLNSFIGMKYDEAKKLSKVIKIVFKKNENIIISLNFDFPDIIDLLTVPQLILKSSVQGVFSGPFYPVKWVKNKNMMLIRVNIRKNDPNSISILSSPSLSSSSSSSLS